MARDVAPQSNGERLPGALKRLALQDFAQGDQLHLVVGNLDADVTPPRHRRLDADARRCQREGQVIAQRDNLAHPDAGAPGAGLHELRLHAKLRDRRPAVDLHHLHGRAEGGQGLLDEMSPVDKEFLVH